MFIFCRGAIKLSVKGNIVTKHAVKDCFYALNNLDIKTKKNMV